jgi:hypothetical protein
VSRATKTPTGLAPLSHGSRMDEFRSNSGGGEEKRRRRQPRKNAQTPKRPSLSKMIARSA